jgi:hypothetical protein
MKNLFCVLAALVFLSGCANQANSVRVSRDVAPTPVVAKPATARTEPIFYNGKTYTLAFSPGEKGSYAMAVRGMTGAQQKDATNVATSAIRYFACPDGKTGKLVENPRYVENEWRMTTRCG